MAELRCNQLGQARLRALRQDADDLSDHAGDAAAADTTIVVYALHRLVDAHLGQRQPELRRQHLTKNRQHSRADCQRFGHQQSHRLWPSHYRQLELNERHIVHAEWCGGGGFRQHE
jgi:hypothetical protein